MPSLSASIEPPLPHALPRTRRKSTVPLDLSSWAATPTRADYVTIPVAAAITGYSAKAIRRKIEAGVWLEGREFRRAPDGHVLISVKGYELWVERGRA
jgi:hypothetical protein